MEYNRKPIVFIIAMTGMITLILLFVFLLDDKSKGTNITNATTTTANVAAVTPSTICPMSSEDILLKEQCLQSFEKRLSDSLLKYCYDKFHHEKLIIYSKWNKTEIVWLSPTIRSVSKFLKTIFKEAGSLGDKQTYTYRLIPFIDVVFQNGYIEKAVLEDRCIVSPYTVYTMYHWLCF